MSSVRLCIVHCLGVTALLSACTGSAPESTATVVTPDYQREARLASAVSNLLWDGEIIDLTPAAPHSEKHIDESGASPNSESASAEDGRSGLSNNSDTSIIADNAVSSDNSSSPNDSGIPNDPSALAGVGSSGSATSLGGAGGSSSEVNSGDLSSADDARTFIAVHTPVLHDAHSGVVLMLHGRGHHPLRTNPNDALRIDLSNAGIPSLAIQLPVLKIGLAWNEYVPLLPLARRRISAALDWLNQRYPDGKVHVVAHSCGVHMMMDWIDHHSDTRLASFTGLAMHNFVPDQKPHAPYPIERMRIPIFDVMAQRSAPAVLRRAWLRHAQARAGNTPYKQLVIADVKSTFEGRETELAAAVIDFIAPTKSNALPTPMTAESTALPRPAATEPNTLPGAAESNELPAPAATE